MSVRVTYEHELGLLNQDLMEMAHMVERAIEQTFTAFEDQDFQMAEDIIKGDRTVNDIEARCLSLILRQQPVAGDLRQVSTALKVVTDLERIGDHASDIAELILRIKSDHAYHIVKHLPAMAAAAGKMVHDAIEAFINRDLDAAVSIIKRDDEVDNLFNQVKTDVIQLLRVSPDQADQGIDLLMVAKYLERIGDHAVNVCEWTQFSRTGALNNVRIMEIDRACAVARAVHRAVRRCGRTPFTFIFRCFKIKISRTARAESERKRSVGNESIADQWKPSRGGMYIHGPGGGGPCAARGRCGDRADPDRHRSGSRLHRLRAL